MLIEPAHEANLARAFANDDALREERVGVNADGALDIIGRSDRIHRMPPGRAARDE